MTAADEPMTTEEVGKLMGLTIHGVRYLIRKGTLKAERFGGIYLIRKADALAVKDQRPKPGRPSGKKLIARLARGVGRTPA